MSDQTASPDLVALWREANTALNAGDLDGVMLFYAPDAVMDTTRTLGMVDTGRESIRCKYDDWLAAYEQWTVTLEEPVDLGNGVAFAIVRQEARLPGARGSVVQREGVISIYSLGQVTHQVFYQDIEAARATADSLVAERA